MKDNLAVRIVVCAVGLVLAVYVGVLTRNAMEQYRYIGKVAHDRDTITIQGTGKVTSKPDIAMISLGVYSDAATVRDAQKDNTTKMNAILAAVKAMGVAEADLQTTGYSIQPKFDWSNGRQNITGYTVSQQVEVKVRDLDKAGDILAKGGELGANQSGGINFTIEDPKKLQEEARGKAIADARKKADQLASQLGLHIVAVVTFSENGGGMPVPQPYMMKAVDSAAGAPSAPPEIQAGTQDVVSDVSVTFEVK